jgi:F-type H+-transporting ATPase subunit b
MLIDWFTVMAQVVNFLILVWLLKRFLYKPVLNAIDVREKRIAKELADADAKQKQAQLERDEIANKNKVFDEQRGTLLSKATDDAKAEHDRLVQQAREAADALGKSRHDALIIEAAQLNQALLQRTQLEVFAIARKTLNDLADVSLEERVVDVFISRLATMPPVMKTTLGAALTNGAEPAVIRSAFDLPHAQQVAIQDALNLTFGTSIKVHFETVPDLVSGIEIMAGGQKLGWTIGSYLGSLKSSVDDVLNQKAAAAQPTMPPPAIVTPAAPAPVHSAAAP